MRDHTPVVAERLEWCKASTSVLDGDGAALVLHAGQIECI